jgi:TP901-1 family phage major tail protein
MSLPVAGSDCLLRIASGHANSSLILVEGLRLSGWTVSQEGVEVTDASDKGWRRLLPDAGLRSLEVRLSGLFLRSEGELRLREVAFSGTAAACELTLEQGVAVRGRFIVSELHFDSAVNEEVTYAATLRSAGLVTVG